MHKNSNNFILNYFYRYHEKLFEISLVQVANDGLMVPHSSNICECYFIHTKKSYTHLPIRTFLSIDFVRIQTTWQKYSQYNSNVNIQYALKRWDNWTCVLFENKKKWKRSACETREIFADVFFLLWVNGLYFDVN